VFERDANSIQLIADSDNRIAAEQTAIQRNLMAVALHVLFASDPELFDEALAQYSYTVPLNSLAIQWGLSVAIFLVLITDGTLFGCRKCIGYIRKRKRVKTVNP